MKDRILLKAKKQFRLGNFTNVIRLLEPEVFRNRENENFYYYLGMSCLLLGDLSGANSYLRRSLQINPSSTNTLLGLAAIHMRHNNLSEAIRIWLDILDREPGNRYAKKALDIVKKSGVLEKVPEDFVARNLSKIVPWKKDIIIQKFLRWLFLFLATAVISAAVFTGFQAAKKALDKSSMLYPELAISRDLKDLTGTGQAVVELGAREVVEIFEKAKKLFMDGKDNEARIEINRLLASNASESVKEKAVLLSGYLREPDFRYFTNTISFRDASEKPYLYNNCHVKWSGRIANIRLEQDRAVFDLLVGYDSGRIVEGIIQVTADFPVVLDEEFTYDIIGQLNTSDGFKLKAVSLRNYIK